VEYALTPNWTIKGEALYVKLESTTSSSQVIDFSTPPFPVFNVRYDTSLVLVRAGLNYKFNWAPVPVVAKY
jgi:outer membrane immunogenic protein